MIIQTDASKRNGGIFQRSLHRGELSRKEQGHQVNVLELTTVKFAILKFTNNLSNITTHNQMNNKVALLYFLKIGVLTAQKFWK